MNWLRKHPLFLLAIALALQLGVAFLNYDFCDDNDLVRINQISIADDGDLLNFLRKIPKVFVTAVGTSQTACVNPFATKSFNYINPASTHRMSPVLRC